MKKTLKLIPAIVMLLISAILVSTSTYAWFSMNTQVSATGMQVQAKVTGSLYISAADTKPAAADITLSTVEINNTRALLKPTSTGSLADNAWYKAAANAPGVYTKTSADYEAVDAENLDDYRYVKTVYVRSESAFTNLQVQGIAVTTAHADTIDGALTVVLKCTDSGGQTVWYCNEATSQRHGVVTGPTTLSDSTVTFTQIQPSSLSGILLPTGAANTVYTIQIYVYYDGESTSCYTNAANGVDVKGCDVAVTFGATFS